MKLPEIMSSDVRRVKPDNHLVEAAGSMRERDATSRCTRSPRSAAKR
jgi:hypothetical protein